MRNKYSLLHQQSLRLIKDEFTSGINELIMFTTQDERLDGKRITLNGKQLVNFGSCSYMGLEVDTRLKEGAIDSIIRYGSQFASSRVYVSVTPYLEAENKLSEIFGSPIILGPTVTLGHQSSIPILVDDNDVVLIDNRAHESIQTSVRMLDLRGIRIETVKHNSLTHLEDKIKKWKDSCNKIWYLCDGVYSMHGDFAPLPELKTLLDTYEQFHLYIDDAHGMGWAGKNGSGYVKSKIEMHPKLYLITSLAKSFACSGSALVFPDEESRNKIRLAGNTMIFSGPLQPAILGSIIASAKIHLSNEIYERQAELMRRISYFNKTAELYNLPLIAPSNSPIFFIGVGTIPVAHNVTKKIFNRGYYLNVATFPSVPVNQCGLRIPITLHHSNEDIENLLAVIAEVLPQALKEENYSMEEIHKSFGLKGKETIQLPTN